MSITTILHILCASGGTVAGYFGRPVVSRIVAAVKAFRAPPAA